MSDFFSDMQDRYRRKQGSGENGALPPASASGPGALPPHWARDTQQNGQPPQEPPIAPPTPSGPQPTMLDAADRYTLDALWEMLLRRRYWIAISLLLVTSMGVYKTYTRPLHYRARASFTDTRVDTMRRDRRESDIDWWQGDAPVHEARQLRSRSLLQDMVGRIPAEIEKLGIPKDDPAHQMAASLKWRHLVGAIEVTPAKGEKRLVSVHATSTNPVLAAAIANATIHAISRQSLKWRKQRAESLVKTLTRIIASKRQAMEKLEEQLQQENKRLMKQGKKAQDLTKENQAQLRVVERLRFEQEKASSSLQELETRIAQLKRKIKEALPDSAEIFGNAAANDQYAKRIKDLQIQRESLLVTLTPSNPKVRALEQQIEAITELRKRVLAKQMRSNLRDEGPLVNRLKEELYLAEIDRNGLRQRLKTYDAVIEKRSRALLSVDSAQLPLAKLHTRKEVLIKVIANLEQRSAEVAVEGGVEDSGIRQVDEASPPTAPRGASRKTLLVGWIMAGLAVGLVVAYLLDSMSSTIKGPAPVQRMLGLPTLGLIPWIRPDDSTRYIDPKNSTAKLAEACGVIRNNIRFSAPDIFQKPLLITSPLPGEGKSLITANLAISFAMEGNSVLLIDGDLRKKRPEAFHEALGITREEASAGLNELLRGTATLDDAAYASRNIPGLHWMPSGRTPSNPAMVLRSGLLPGLYDQASARFEVVIVDSPALLPIADTVQMARDTHVLLVLANEETRINAAMQANHRLRHIGAEMIGMIINKAAGYVTSHYYGYSRYYAYRYAYSDNSEE